ncbi:MULTISPECIES: recombinase RecT [Shewanella]|uniref:recombinase RecT n=1 Tax=Shewanella TaxID=22 RepID=UPI00217F1A80|nr:MULTISPECIES: recombinase RecT [Shewanella]MCS6128788.1 recombinase RecT [Shewanella baltica]MCS6140657.1 recombinase RecT [Shewanella baltica]MCS6147002.1 recombinase RecT [Shewanella baltica]MCS6171532.1 recombinase RecT [Shewanella baltica]MCS6188694.1 recombinase RecT [Shewanella baltica]
MSTRYTSADAAHYVQHLCVEFDTAYPNNNFPYSELNILFAQLQRLLMLNPSQIGWVNIHSVFDVMTELTQAQISLNPNRKQASILLGAYYDSGWLGVQLCWTYRGYRDAAAKAGIIRSARPVIVYEADDFQWIDSFTPPRHQYDPFSKNRGNIRGAYCVAELAGGGVCVTHFTFDDLMTTFEHRQVATRAWNEFFVGMILAKTVRLSEKAWSEAA